MTKKMGIAEALREAISEEMRRDQKVFCIGEDIAVPGGWGGAFTVTLGLENEFPDRMIDTPIAKLGFFGVACGVAMMGMRPIADVQYGDFLFVAIDQIIDNIAKMRYMSGGQISMPLVIRAPIGATGRGSQHAQSMERKLPANMAAANGARNTPGRPSTGCQRDVQRSLPFTITNRRGNSTQRRGRISRTFVIGTRMPLVNNVSAGVLSENNRLRHSRLRFGLVWLWKISRIFAVAVVCFG